MQRKMLRAYLAEEVVRHSHHNAGTVTSVDLATTCTAMSHADEHFEGISDLNWATHRECNKSRGRPVKLRQPYIVKWNNGDGQIKIGGAS